MPQDSADFTGRMATVSGWGRLKYGGGVPSVLQEVQVRICTTCIIFVVHAIRSYDVRAHILFYFFSAVTFPLMFDDRYFAVFSGANN